MPKPHIEVLGVYSLPVTDELFQRDFQIRWESSEPDFDRAAALQQCRKELESVVLIELMVQNTSHQFDPSDFDFTQEEPRLPRGEWQAPWAEAYLSEDGNSYAGKFRWSVPEHPQLVRVAFFMHYWDPSKPLLSSFGEIPCPSPQSMPQRLQRLAPYEILD